MEIHHQLAQNQRLELWHVYHFDIKWSSSKMQMPYVAVARRVGGWVGVTREAFGICIFGDDHFYELQNKMIQIVISDVFDKNDVHILVL